MSRSRAVAPSTKSVSRQSSIQRTPDSQHTTPFNCEASKTDQATVEGIAKITQVLPARGQSKTLGEATAQVLHNMHRYNPSFFQAFGLLGLPLLFIMLLCLAWTSWLIFVSLEPNQAANVLMNTSSYDNGQFWLIIDSNPKLTRAGVAGLFVVGLSYSLVILKMTLWRGKDFTPTVLKQLEGRLLDSWKGSRLEAKTLSIFIAPTYRRIHQHWNELSSFNGRKRKYWNVCTKSVDLVMQTILLMQLLNRGSPVELVYGFTTFLAVNAFSCATNILTDRFSVLTEILIDSIFDFSAAVLFPIITLVYCYFNFDFDRAVYLSYLEKLPAGSFEHNARACADQSEVALFRVNFDSLRFSSPLEILVCVAMNLAFCYRVRRVIEVISWQRYKAWQLKGSQRKQIDMQGPKVPVPKPMAILFAAFGVAIAVLARYAVSNSTASCSAYPECVVHTYHWTASSNESCVCLIFIDVDKAPRTYENWIYPPDAFGKLKALARAGRLESIQVINRQLMRFPEELRTCKHLKAIQLMYTDIQVLPAWMKELTQLESLHIEGKRASANLRNLPEELFSNMPNLVMVYFGIHEHLDRIPPLSGVPNLQALTLVWMFHLPQIPSFELVPNLRRLTLVILPLLEWVPDMAPLQNLLGLTVRLSHICCNGFLGICNLTDFICLENPTVGFPQGTCLVNSTNGVLPYLGSVDTKNAFDKFSSTICAKNPYDARIFSSGVTKATIDPCGGTLFRQCRLPSNATGICYNARMQVISCSADGSYVGLRRYQIENGVGPPCDPVEEKWLGCRE